MIFSFLRKLTKLCDMPLPLVLNVNAILASLLSLHNAWLHRERWLSNHFDFHVTQSDDNLT